MVKPKEFPEQNHDTPGQEFKMHPQPEIINANYKGSGKLEGKTALITSGETGVGTSVALSLN